MSRQTLARRVLLLALAAAIAALLVASRAGGEEPPPVLTLPPCAEPCEPPPGVEPDPLPELVLVDGHDVYWWAERAGRLSDRNAMLSRRLRRLEKLVGRRWRPTALYAIRLASIVYGVPRRDMLTVARCESPGLNPFLQHPTSRAAGLFQFLPSTWAGPWGAKKFAASGFSVWDPVANALAAAYIVDRDGGWFQWTCKP